MSTSAAALVIGVGNPLRGDDGVGPVVAEALCTVLGPDWEYLPFSGSGLDLVTALAGREQVVVIDALVNDAVAVGECCRITPPVTPLPESFPSSHRAGVLEAFALARRLGLPLPEELTVFGIGVTAEALADYREGLTEALSSRVPEIVRQLGREIPALRKGAGS